MYKIPANTVFLGKNMVYVPQCHSTNTFAAELSQKDEIAEGTIVVTDYQFAGRGQRGSSWEAAPGQNLTFSVIFRPRFLPAMEQFNINRVVSLGVTDYLQDRILNETPVCIKWPNDLLAGDKKLGGILIENHIHAATIQCSIAGIGLNINQESFSYPKAASLRSITHRLYHLPDELVSLAEYIEVRYLQLKQNKVDDLEKSYLKKLYRLDHVHRFRSNGHEWDGTITGVDDVGRLRIKTADEERVFGVKEVTFL